MHIVLLRHCSRIDKTKLGVSPVQSGTGLSDGSSSNWLSNFDPPLNDTLAQNEMENVFRKIANNIPTNDGARSIMLHSSPYNRCIQTTELLLDRIKHSKQFEPSSENKQTVKLRVDQCLSEWLSENYNLKYLPPNDDGYSMINNINAYLNEPENENETENLNFRTRCQLKSIKDSTWSYNKLGHCGEYGESPKKFTKRCFNYLVSLLQYYYAKQTFEDDKHTVVFIISHGAIISTLLQILLGRAIFNEIPLCTPIYFKQSETQRSVFKLMDYDFNLNNILSPSSDKDFYRMLETSIDLAQLDGDNLRSELTIGTTGYTTIIQNISQRDKPKNEEPTIGGRKRRNTINIGDKEKDTQDEKDKVSLKQTLSSKQLYLLNKDTSEEKIIDLDKLHSYFGSNSESESESESDYEDASSKFSGHISSLASFNEQNKTKFQLNMKNFFSSTSPIETNPFSHFFMARSNSSFHQEGISKIKGELNNQKNEFFVKAFTGDENMKNNKEENEEEEEEEKEEGPVLSFGTGRKLAVLQDEEERKQMKMKNKDEDELQGVTMIEGTFSNVPVRSSTNMARQDSSSKVGLDSILNSPSLLLSSGKLIKPRLISTSGISETRLMDSDTTADDVSDEETLKGGSNSSTEELDNDDGVLNFDTDHSKQALRQILFNSRESDSEEEDGQDQGGWFGGFQR